MNMTSESKMMDDLPLKTEYANTAMGVAQLAMLLFYGFLKLRKRMQNNEVKTQELENRLISLKRHNPR